MRIEGENLFLRPLEPEDEEELWRLRIRNKYFLKPFEPLRGDDYYGMDRVREAVRGYRQDWEERRAYTFGIFDGGTSGLIGTVSLTGVTYGVFQSAHLGYCLDESHTGGGRMSQAVRLVQKFAFGEAGLHRLQAAVMLRNPASLRVLEKNGFWLIGLSPRYLKINGRWEDHLLLAKTAEDWTA